MKNASARQRGPAHPGNGRSDSPQAYAVIHVADFSLQAVLRSDPSLALPKISDAASPESANEKKVSQSTKETPRPDTLTAVNAASFNLPRGTGSARGPEIRPEPELACAEQAPCAADDSEKELGHGLQTSSRHGIGSASGGASPNAQSESEYSLFKHVASILPFAIVSGDTKKSLVLQANSDARREGVEIGMTAPQAQARCAHLVFRQRSPSAEAEAQCLLLTCALNIAPSVEDTAPGVCTIDVRGLDPDNRSRSLAHAICELRALGLSATGGIAATPLLARYAACETTSVRTVANASAFLHPLPLTVAEPNLELMEILRGWGITTIGQFTALPKQEVIRRLGGAGLALWERARGGEPRPLKPYTPSQQFSAALDLEYEIETTEGVLFILRRFVDRLSLELRTAGFVASEMILGLKLADETRYERSFRLPEPTAREDILFRTLLTHLESLRTASCVAGASLQVVPVRPLLRQPGLFETGLRDPHGFSETLSRVTAVVGSGQLGTPQLEDTYRPDAVKLTTPLAVVSTMEPSPVWPGAGLPLRRFRPPVAAHIELTRNGHPAFISGPQLHSPVTAARGPWRSSGDWWKPETWSREEWDIELAIGGLYRVAKVGGEWYLDGEYE